MSKYTEERQAKLLRAAVDAWGPAAQCDVFKEELAELIVAISHFKRNRGGALFEVLEEIADVELMCEQMKYILERVTVEPEEQIEEIKQQKVLRTMTKIRDGEPGVFHRYFSESDLDTD